MARHKFTDAAVKRLKAPENGRVEYWDASLPGFGLRITDKGSRSWVVMFRVRGRLRRLTLGSYPAISLKDARREAGEAMREAAAGNDPAAAKALTKRQWAEPNAFRSVAEAWLADTGKRGGARLRSKKAIESQLARDVFPILGAVPVTEITRSDVRDLVRSIAVERPVAANRCLAIVRRTFSWAIREDKIDANPATNIDPPGEEISRDRVLNDAEIAKLWPACEELGYPFGPAVQIMLLTGARRSEVSGIRWSEIDGDTWYLPADRTKNRRPHIVPLSTTALEILGALPRIDSLDHVFTTGRGSTRDEATGKRVTDRPVTGWARPKQRLDRIANLADWNIHDIRRTLVTGMNEKLGIEPHIVEAVVNHVSGAAKAGVAGVYNRAQYLPQRRAALQSWANELASIINPEDDEKVVPMARRAPTRQ